MSTHMLALSTVDVSKYGTVGVIVVIVVGLVLVSMIREIVGRIIALVITVAFAAVLWGQRSSILDCAQRVKSSVAANPTAMASTECSAFGFTFTVPLDKLSPPAN